MTPKDLAEDLIFLRANGLVSRDLTRLHHFSLVLRSVSIADAIAYFESKTSLRGQNRSLAERCHYVADQLRAGRSGLQLLSSEALARWPLAQASQPKETLPRSSTTETKPSKLPGACQRTSKELGDVGEAISVALLLERGYNATLLRPNYPTYDVLVEAQGRSFFISVKVARKSKHLRLGSRQSVARLATEDFVFAFLPRTANEVNFESGDYTLLILPAAEVRDYALEVHDAYWAAKGKPNGFSVMVKAYDPLHASQWLAWSRYENAWHLLPRSDS